MHGAHGFTVEGPNISGDFSADLVASELGTPIAFCPNAVAHIACFGNPLPFFGRSSAIGDGSILRLLGLAVVLCDHVDVRHCRRRW